MNICIRVSIYPTRKSNSGTRSFRSSPSQATVRIEVVHGVLVVVRGLYCWSPCQSPATMLDSILPPTQPPRSWTRLCPSDCRIRGIPERFGTSWEHNPRVFWKRRWSAHRWGAVDRSKICLVRITERLDDAPVSVQNGTQAHIRNRARIKLIEKFTSKIPIIIIELHSSDDGSSDGQRWHQNCRYTIIIVIIIINHHHPLKLGTDQFLAYYWLCSCNSGILAKSVRVSYGYAPLLLDVNLQNLTLILWLIEWLRHRSTDRPIDQLSKWPTSLSTYLVV